MNRRKPIFGVLALLLLAMNARADHLADKLAAKGRPETRLAGIHLTNHTKLADVIKLYGKPTRIESWESTDPHVWTQYACDWIRARLNLHVVVDGPANEVPEKGFVSLIAVRAGTSKKIARTGRGLRIGQSLKDLKRLYGRRYHLTNIPAKNIHDVALAWRPEFTLIAGLDSRNRITSLTLVAPE